MTDIIQDSISFQVRAEKTLVNDSTKVLDTTISLEKIDKAERELCWIIFKNLYEEVKDINSKFPWLNYRIGSIDYRKIDSSEVSFGNALKVSILANVVLQSKFRVY